MNLRLLFYFGLPSAVLRLCYPGQVIPVSGVVCLHRTRCGAAVQYDIRGLLFQPLDMFGMLGGDITFFGRVGL